MTEAKVRYSDEHEAIIRHRGSHLQVVACAGSGKTETVSMRLALRGHPRDIVPFVAPTAQVEAELIADAISRMRTSGIPWRIIAILLRSVRTSTSAYLDEFDRRDIPYRCLGRTGRFLQPEAELLGRLYAWLAGRDQFYNARARDYRSAELGVRRLPRERRA